MSKVFLCLLVLGSFCLPAPFAALAQDAGAAGSAAGEADAEDDLEILVTASRVDEEIARAAAGVIVLDEEDLRAPGNQTVADALEKVAGLQFRSYSGNAAQAVASMRGFSENSHGRVLVLIDGRRLNMMDMRAPNWLQIPLERVERVEIVRGGNTALYGDNALGGVINIITRRGAEELEVEVTGSGGSFAAHREAVSVRGAAGDRLRYSLSGQYGAGEGYRERSGYASAGGGASLEMDLSEALTSSLSLSYDQLSYEMPGELTEAEVASDPTQAGNPADETAEQYLNAGWNLTLQTSAGLWEADLTYGWKLFETDMPSTFIPSVMDPLFTDRTYQSAGLSPRFSGDHTLGSRRGRLVAGVDLGLDLLTYESYTSADRTTLDRAADLSRLDLGAYLSDDLDLRPDLTVSGGLRCEIARIAIQGTTAVSLNDDVVHQVLAGNASVLYHVPEGHKAYLRYERVYRLPFVDEQISYQGFGDAFYGDLDPEKGHNVELGSEVVLAPGIKAAAGIYVLAMTDEIAYSWATSSNENLDETLHYGGEAELAARLGKILHLQGSYSYTRAFFLEGANEGKELALVPNHAAAGEVDVELIPGLTLGAEVSYVGESYKDWDAANEGEPLTAYTVCGLSLSFRTPAGAGSLELNASVDNIFDEHYSTWAQYGFGGDDTYYPAPGRSWTVGGSYRY